jgi:hypothetical protein
MKIRPIVVSGLGLAAAFSLVAASTTAFADTALPDLGLGQSSLVNVVGNQIGALGNASSNQVAAQPALGQFLLGQANPAAPVKAFSPGNTGTVDQGNELAGWGQNSGQASQTIDQTDSSLPGGGGLIDVVGNQVGGLLNVSDNEAALQAALGQVGIAQANLNSPIRLVSAGDNGHVTQVNAAQGAAGNWGEASQTNTSGGGSNSLIGIVGNSIGLVNASDNQGVLQGAIGQLGIVQLNVNTPVRVLSPGDNGGATQVNEAQGTGTNKGAVAQNNGGPVGFLGGLLGTGNQIGLVNISDEQVGGQGALGQLGVLQVNVNLPVRVLSTGSNGQQQQVNAQTSSQTNSAGKVDSGTLSNADAPSQSDPLGQLLNAFNVL